MNVLLCLIYKLSFIIGIICIGKNSIYKVGTTHDFSIHWESGSISPLDNRGDCDSNRTTLVVIFIGSATKLVNLFTVPSSETELQRVTGLPK